MFNLQKGLFKVLPKLKLNLKGILLENIILKISNQVS